MSHRIIIADKDSAHIETLKSYIESFGSEFSVMGTLESGSQLLKTVFNETPDVVISDVDLTDISGLEVMRCCRTAQLPCHFIIMTGKTDFNYAYEAIQQKVDAFLLKPIDSSALQHALNDICCKNDSSFSKTSRRYFIKEAARTLHYHTLPVEKINLTYGTRFFAPLYQALILKLDCHDFYLLESYNFHHSLTSKVEHLIYQFLLPVCSDVVVTDDNYKFQILLNFSQDSADQIHNAIQGLFMVAKNLFLPEDFSVTISTGAVHLHPDEIIDSIREGSDMLWLRLFYGTGRIIYWQDNKNSDSYEIQNMISTFSHDLRNAFDTLDFDAFQDVIGRLFQLSPDQLSQHRMRIFIQHIPALFFEINDPKIRVFHDTDKLKRELNNSLNTVFDINTYIEVLTTRIQELFLQIEQCIDSHYSRPVFLAQKYIKENYRKPLQLIDVADAISLNPAYLSSIFKKEVGQSFTAYLNEHRINISKNKLRITNQSVKDISVSVGFSDSNYYTKVFKNLVGVTPSEYRSQLNL